MTTASGPARRGLSRAVVFAGIALGTFVTVIAYVDGYRPPASGLAALLAGVITWVLLAALAVTVIEMLRRHHRAIGRHGWRYSKRGAIAAGVGAAAAARAAAARSRPWRTRVLAALRARWAARSSQPLMFRRLRREPEDPATEAVPAEEPGGGPGRPAVTYVNGTPSQPPAEGSTTMPEAPAGSNVTGWRAASRITPGRRARRTAARSGGSVPAEWGPVIAQAADFEPEDDGELLEWMTRQVTGLSGWAEALVDFYEHATNVIGIDPKASAMLHDVADAAAQAAETMGAAKTKFTEHYELPREFAANGGLMTHDGRWVTGEGA
jgi:hypothetical protein